VSMNSGAPWPLRILGRLIGLAIVVTGIAAAVMAVRTSTGNPRTDDAYVTANVIGIAPHVEGTLVQLNVVDNQPVEENDLLFVVDPRPYQAELERARGELILAQAEVGGIEQAITAARAEAGGHRLCAHPCRPAGRFISADQYQEAVTKARSLDAAVQHAQSQLAQQEELLAQQGDVNGRLETAKARVRLAELNVEYCYVRAPFKGLRASNPRLFFVHLWLAAPLALRDELDEARSALAQSLKLKPEINSLARWRSAYPWYANPQFVALAEPTLYAGLRRADFPEE